MLWEEDSAKLAVWRKLNPPPQPVAEQPKKNPAPQPVVEQPKQDPAPPPAAEQVSLNAKAPSTPEPAAASAPEVNAAAANEELTLTKIYRVGPNDVLDIRINDNAASQSTLFTVTPSGFIDHPMLGEPMQASGLTVDEIGSKFESELKRRALAENPKVSVGVRDYASHTILVSGLVKDSGTKVLRREAIPLYVVVADAQPLPEAVRVTVLRSESNATFAVELGQTNEMNLLVRPGDVITLLASEAQFIYVGGEVKAPGEKPFRRGLTLTQAIIAGGGVMPGAKEARVARDNGEGFLAVTRYKLKDVESGKVQDPVVKPGDRITIRN
jgi:protein involved in polysaccharide export with SLBB domain